MRDPYLYDDIHVIRNELGIRNQVLLDNAEADYVVYRLKDLALSPLSGDYHTGHLQRMHKYIFIGRGSMRYTDRDYNVGAMMLLLKVLVLYKTDEALLLKALNEFSDVYDEKIPGWFETVYQFFGGYPESELQMAALNKYASQHQIKAEAPEKVDRELLYDALGMLIETSTEIEERGAE